ncbi:hypothetical protein [Streptomyces antibioticus]
MADCGPTADRSMDLTVPEYADLTVPESRAIRLWRLRDGQVPTPSAR